MATVIDHDQQQQQQTYKHYCRICKRGFGCGRALGGHMRAHGINDDDSAGNNADQEDVDPSGCSDWGPADARPPSNKRMYALRANPNRIRSCRVCEGCGEEFVSWKSFVEHGKCSSDDGPAGWSKGKRSRRASCKPVAEEEDLANCLVLLSAARADQVFVAEPEESCASASMDEDRRHYNPSPKAPAVEALSDPAPKGMFECKACKKVFKSHQALGGHRASHKKVKGCFAAKPDAGPDEPPPEDDVMTTNESRDAAVEAAAATMAMAMAHRKRPKVHECSVCRRQFASGQALGGHKRCHWITSASGGSPSPMARLQAQILGQNGQQRRERTLRTTETLDLNLPAPAEMRQDYIVSPLRLDVPAALYLQQPWVDHKNNNNNNNVYNNDDEDDNDDDDDDSEGGCSVNNNNNNNSNNNYNNNGDGEVGSRVKLAKLSELKDMNGRGEVSPWLHVGISSSGEGREP